MTKRDCGEEDVHLGEQWGQSFTDCFQPQIMSDWHSLAFCPCHPFPVAFSCLSSNSPVSLWVCPFYDSLGLGARHCGTLPATQQGLELLQQLVERREAGQGLLQAADAQGTSGDLSVGDRTPALKGNLPTCSLITTWGSQQGSTSEGTWDPSRRAAQNQA